MVLSWTEQVPEEFRFVMKATRRITHLKRLKEVEEETAYFVDIAANLGSRMGAVLFQLPPHLKKDMTRLKIFADLIPDGFPAAMEFRHESWFDNEVRECLSSKNIALCFAHEDDDDPETVETRFSATATWGYLRLRGSEYADGELEAYAERVMSQKWDRAFVFFKHETAGLGPELARRFSDLGA